MSIYLHKIAFLDQFRDLLFRQPKHVARCFFELLLFIGVDVLSLALREAVNEHRALTLLEQNDRAVAARFALPRSRDPLLDNPTAEISVQLPLFRACYRVQQNRVADLFPSGKPLKPSRLEDSRLGQLGFHTPLFYSTRYYVSRLWARYHSLPISLPTPPKNRS